MSNYNIIASTDESTVVAEYTPTPMREDSYQSEAQLEQEFEYIDATSEAGLVANLRCQLGALNDYSFSDSEWDRFFRECVAGANDGIVEKTRRMQDDHAQILKRDDGSTKNIHNNRLQALNQYEEIGGAQ